MIYFIEEKSGFILRSCSGTAWCDVVSVYYLIRLCYSIWACRAGLDHIFHGNSNPAQPDDGFFFFKYIYFYFTV